jgi:hypothetical protein
MSKAIKGVCHPVFVAVLLALSTVHARAFGVADAGIVRLNDKLTVIAEVSSALYEDEMLGLVNPFGEVTDNAIIPPSLPPQRVYRRPAWVIRDHGQRGWFE